jgi:hypothetical protein
MLRAAVFAAVLALAAPAAALADSSIWAQDLPVSGARTLAASTPREPFQLVGLHWQGPGRVSFRTHSLSGGWSGWRAAAPEPEDEPDHGSAEGASRRGWRLGNPYWVGRSDRLDVRTTGEIRRLRAWYVRTDVHREPLRTVASAGSPTILSRAAWSADERIVRATPIVAPRLQLAVVHHTAGAASTDLDVSAAIVRGIELYHVRANGWNDIGYNFLVDSAGNVFEGRRGGIDRNVVGAHAQGFNTGSVGVAVIGTYSSRGITPAARAALVSLLAWRLDVAHVDPSQRLSFTSLGNPKYPAGRAVSLRAVSGHRDTGFTTCPGNALYAQLPGIAQEVARTGLPKLYAPVAQGTPGGPVTFTARLSTPEPWTVTVRDAGGIVVAQGTGVSSSVAWTWNAALVPRTASYTWTIEAPDLRPAQGSFGALLPSPPAAVASGTPPPLPPLLQDVVFNPPTVSPNGDGFADSGTLAYTLGARAFVSLSVLDATGAVAATVLTDQRQGAKRQSFTVPLDLLRDGHYTVSVTVHAEADTRTASFAVPVVVDRTLAAVTTASPVFSPNGDGVQDTAPVTFQLAAPADVTVRVEQGGVVLTTLLTASLPAGPQQAAWDGNTPTGPAPEGTYDLVVLARTALGETRQSVPVVLTRH